MDLPQGVVFSEERLKHSLIHNINEFSNLEKNSSGIVSGIWK